MINKTISYRVFIPEQIKIALTNSKLPLRDSEACSWFLSCLYTRQDGDSSSGVPMWSPLLRRIMGDNYKHLIAKLLTPEGFKWVERIKGYHPGQSSIRYSLTQEAKDMVWLPSELSSPLIRARLYRSRLRVQQERMKPIKASPVLAQLNDTLGEVELPGLSRRELLTLAVPDKDTPFAKLDLSRQHRAAKAEEALLMLRNKDTLQVGPSGRVFSGLTQIPREYRHLIRLRGQPLMGVDVRNSQPLILAAVIRKERPEMAGASDVVEYTSLCERGELYDALAVKAGMSPDATKKRFFAVFFGRVPLQSWTLSKLTKTFRDTFPTAWKIVCELKTRDTPTIRANHANLARLMQKMESDIVIQDAAASLLQRGIPVLTIHDSLLSCPEYIGDLTEALKEAFAKYDLIPTLRREDYSNTTPSVAVGLAPSGEPQTQPIDPLNPG